jgi:hypothetical protein
VEVVQQELQDRDDATTPELQQQQQKGTAMFAGGVELPVTSVLHIVKAEAQPRWPVFRLTDAEGALLEGAAEPDLSAEDAMKMVHCMVSLLHTGLDHCLMRVCASRLGNVSARAAIARKGGSRALRCATAMNSVLFCARMSVKFCFEARQPLSCHCC